MSCTCSCIEKSDLGESGVSSLTDFLINARRGSREACEHRGHTLEIFPLHHLRAGDNGCAVPQKVLWRRPNVFEGIWTVPSGLIHSSRRTGAKTEWSLNITTNISRPVCSLLNVFTTLFDGKQALSFRAIWDSAPCWHGYVTFMQICQMHIQSPALEVFYCCSGLETGEITEIHWNHCCADETTLWHGTRVLLQVAIRSVGVGVSCCVTQSP